MRHALRPIREGENARKSKPYIVCDIETAKWTKFLVIGLYDGKKTQYFKNLEKFLESIFNEYDNCDVFAHFGGKFDFLFILRAILESKKYTFDSIIPRGSGILCFDASSGGKRVTFRDSSALLPFALRTLTENFGVEHKKQTIDYEKITKVTPKLLEYLEYDLKGLYEVIQKFQNQEIIKKAGLSYTIAGQALRVLRTTLERPIPSLSKSLDLQIRQAYFGGRVEIFRPFHNGGKLFAYDVNSLYPTVMRNNIYPGEFDYETDEFEKDKHGFYYCEVEVPETFLIPPLGIVHEGKYIFPTGKFQTFCTTAEINYARSIGCKISTSIGYVFNSSGYLFKEFVETLWKIRQKAKKNSADSMIAKLLLNSCYGKFGIKADKENIVIDDGSEGLKKLGEGFYVGKNYYEFATKAVELETFSNVAIAAYVTAYARIYMHKLYMRNPRSIFYTDTDSIYTTHRFVSGEGLGELKLEDTVNSACFLLPKTYIAGQKIVMKGFDKKKIKKFTIEDFYACLEGDLKRLSITMEPKFSTFKAAMRRGKLVTMTRESPRQLRSRYDKRVIYKKDGEFYTRPIHLKGDENGNESKTNTIKNKKTRLPSKCSN